MKLLSFFKKIFLIFIFTISHILILKNIAQAEIIELRNDEKTFGDWKVYCEIDDMMSSAHCKIASKFYDNSSVISLQPTNHFANEFFIIIPKIKLGSFVKIRVDKNDLIISKNASQKEFGLMPINEQQKNILFSQMKNGEYLFLRFNVNDSEKEITAKFNLKDFNKALEYYSNKVFKK
jgi:invasion protein IalB